MCGYSGICEEAANRCCKILTVMINYSHVKPPAVMAGVPQIARELEESILGGEGGGLRAEGFPGQHDCSCL